MSRYYHPSYRTDTPVVMIRPKVCCSVIWCKKIIRGKFEHGTKPKKNHLKKIQKIALKLGWIDRDENWFCNKHTGFQFNKDYVIN